MSRELTCDEAQALYVDRTSEVELEAETVRSLDAHLEGCVDCQAFAVELGALDARIATTLRESPELNDPELAAATAARVLAAIEAEEGPAVASSAGVGAGPAGAGAGPGGVGAGGGEPAAVTRGGRVSPWPALVAAAALLAIWFGSGWGTTPGTSGTHTAGGQTLEELEERVEELEREVVALQERVEEAERTKEEDEGK